MHVINGLGKSIFCFKSVFALTAIATAFCNFCLTDTSGENWPLMITSAPAEAAQEVDLADTLHHAEMIVNNIFSRLVRPEAGANRSTYAAFRLHSDATVSDWAIRTPSGSPSFDVACSSAMHTAVFSRFEGKDFISVNANFSSDGKSAWVSFSSPDVVGGSSKVDRMIAQAKATHLNTIKIMKTRIASAEKVVGPNDGRLSQSIDFLANEYKAIGDYPNAEANFKRALAIRQKANGTQSKEVAETMTALGELYQAKGDRDAAESQFKEVLAMGELKPRDKIKTMQAYAKMLLKEGKQKESEALFNQINDIMAGKVPSEQSPKKEEPSGKQ